MNVYKYAKRYPEKQLDVLMILDAFKGNDCKPKRRLLMVHWLAWYYYFSRVGNMDAAKHQMRLFIHELKMLSQL